MKSINCKNYPLINSTFASLYLFYFLLFQNHFIVVSPSKKYRKFFIRTESQKRDKNPDHFDATCSVEKSATPVKRENKAATLFHIFQFKIPKGFSTAKMAYSRGKSDHTAASMFIRSWMTAKSWDSSIPTRSPDLNWNLLQLFVESSRSRNFSPPPPIILDSKPRKLCNLRFPGNW